MQKHLHTYERVKGSTTRYRCIHPDCTHFTLKSLLKGVRAVCNGCLESFIMSGESLRRVRPKCQNCIRSGKNHNKVKNLGPSEEAILEILKESGV